MIYHITSSSEWEFQKQATHFTPADYHREGFIHCCTDNQIAGVLQRYFNGKSDLLLIQLDETLLESELKWEASTNTELFPHVYGSLNRNAVIKVTRL